MEYFKTIPLVNQILVGAETYPGITRFPKTRSEKG